LSESFAVSEKSYALWGSSGHAKVLVGIIGRLGGRVAATFDNNADAEPLPGVPLYIGETGFRSWVAEQGDVHDICALVAVGGSRGRDRIAILARMVASGLRAEPLVDPRASVDATAEIGGGCQLLPGAIVSADAVLGEGCILNHKASVDHECQVGSGVHLAPAATLCGLVSVGDAAMVGTNATVLPRIKIGQGAIVGGGAVVTKDVPDHAVVVGNPARVVRIESP
jgi:sugar O-acyltransferase (sialic acid O-acetyltransferase NeuD family)